MLVTGNFTIQSAAGVLQNGAEASAGANIHVASGLRHVNVSFAMDRGGKAALQVFDARGRLVATLLDGRQEAGFHELSLFSGALDFSRPLVFRLKAGERITATLWAGMP